MNDDALSFEPTHSHLCKVWAALGQGARRKRYAEACQRREVIDVVQSCVASGFSEREALRVIFPDQDRSTFRRWKNRYDLHGFEGLFDWRMPGRTAVPERVNEAICTLRRIDPATPVEDIVRHVQMHHDYSMSLATVRRVLRDAGLARPRGAPIRAERCGEQHLELGGMKLVEAAIVQTGYLDGLADGVMAQIEGACWHAEAFRGRESELDQNGRDAYGRFLDSYSQRYIKGDGDVIGPGFSSVEQKRRDKDARLFHVSGAQRSTILRKLQALLVSPLLGSGRWDGIRVPRGELLEELCGYGYMPATLELFTRELKYLGVSSTLWEIHARTVLEQTRHWAASPRQMAVLYIDETSKPVWTDLFAESTRVSSVGRVMPGIEIVSFHSGYGVPLWMVTSSGRTPLVKVVPQLLGELAEHLGGSEVGRIVVIDAEANSVPFLKGLEHGEPSRGWVTRLKASLVKGKRIFNRTNYRSYRSGDRVRVGLCDFNDPAGGTFRMRVVEVERRTKGEVTYLGASTLLGEDEWSAEQIADLYFERWPNQEANFRSVNQAVGLKDVHGYGKELVDNITVVTELDKLKARIHRHKTRHQEGVRQQAEVSSQRKAAEQELRRAERRQETVASHIASQAQEGKAITLNLKQLIEEQQTLSTAILMGTEQLEALVKKEGELLGKLESRESTLSRYLEQQEVLESRRRIFKHDVELDAMFTLLKVGLVFLVTHILKEYLGDATMDAVTFLERVATLPAKLRRTPDLEIVTVEYNRRDPDVMALLAEHCQTINEKKLQTLSHKTLRMEIEPAPPPRRPPPANRRVNPGDRFRKNQP